MSEKTGISWTDATFNPWWGCQKVSPACDHCYAERDAKRFAPGRVLWGVGSERRTFEDKHWRAPMLWAKAMPAKLGRRPRVFCASMADVFDKDGPADARARLWGLIHDTPSLDWLLLTKRIGNARAMLPPDWLRTPIYGELPNWPHNLRIGATFCNQQEVNRDMHKLLDLACPNFVSLEPLLGPINLVHIERHEPDAGRDGDGGWTYIDNALTGFQANKCGGYDGKRVDWVIAGGESGPHARPAHPDWFRSLRDQCAAAGVPFHFKQWGEWAPYDRSRSDGAALATPNALDEPMQHLGKKLAGRLLDGVEHDGFPS